MFQVVHVENNPSFLFRAIYFTNKNKLSLGHLFFSEEEYDERINLHFNTYTRLT